MQEHILLLHGIWMRPAIMSWMARQFQAAGYITHTPAYASLFAKPCDNAARLHDTIGQYSAVDRLHIVAHSLGGIIALHLLTQFSDVPDGRLLTLGSPVRGSQIAKRLAKFKVTKPMLGRSYEQGLSGEGIPERLDREWGMIAGNHAVGMGWMAGGFSEPNDGIVAVAETVHSAQNAYLLLPVSHTGMLFSTRVFSESLHFLRTGHFQTP